MRAGDGAPARLRPRDFPDDYYVTVPLHPGLGPDVIHVITMIHYMTNYMLPTGKMLIISATKLQVSEPGKVAHRDREWHVWANLNLKGPAAPGRQARALAYYHDDHQSLTGGFSTRRDSISRGLPGENSRLVPSRIV